MTIELLEQRLAVLDGPALELRGEVGVHIERLAAAQRMADHDGMDHVAHLVGALEAHGTAVVLRPEHVDRRMDRAEAAQHLLHALRQRLEGEIHVGEQRVAALVRDFARQQDRAHRGLLVVAVVGVPEIADVLLALGLLAHFGDLRIARDGREEPVDVDRRPTLRELDMLLGRQLLVAEEDHAVLHEGLLDFVPLPIAHRLEVDAGNLRAAATRELADFDRLVRHGRSPPRRSMTGEADQANPSQYDL